MDLKRSHSASVTKKPEPNVNLRNVTQFLDERVKLSFDRRSTSSRYSDEGSTSSTIDLGRASQLPWVIYASYPHDQQIQTRVQLRFSTSEIPSSTLRNVDYQTAVPKPVYNS